MSSTTSCSFAPPRPWGGFCGNEAMVWLIDGLGPDGVSARVLDITRSAVRLQTGYVYHYAFAMLIGVALFATWYMFAGRL